ncbi:MAG: protoporphyrinogen oxidase, partial [Nitrospirota bacterium]
LERRSSLDLVVLESENRPGGKIWTDKVNGFLCEGGVNGFLDNRPRTLELVSKLGLTPLKSSDTAKKRYIYSKKRLNLLPESPLSFLSSSLLSLYGRLRVLGEIFVPGSNKEDETLADFARRRLGREAYEKLIDPMASGIYAGDPEKMSLRSCFPRIYELEKEYSSLIKAMIRLKREAKRTGKKVGPGPGGVLTSFHEGMVSIINALAAFLGDRLRIGAKVISVEKRGNNFFIHLSDNSEIEAEVVVIAAPAHTTSEMTRDLSKELSSSLREIFYPAVSVICFGYRREKIKNSLDGFGFLVPYKEGRKILGTLWDSSIFPNRAPEGYVLLRTMLGGVRASELAMQDEAKLVNIVTDELRDIMDIRIEPDFVRVYRHEKAIPQYSPGHAKKLTIIDEMLSRYKGLYLAGNAYRGIGVNDCIENSYKLAERVVKEI